jgi:hypothetical protein
MPANITRGNIEGLIAVTINIVPISMPPKVSTDQVFYVKGMLITDIPITLVMPYFIAGIGISGVSATANDFLRVIFTNVTSSSVVPPAGSYILVLGRPSNASSLPTVSF